MSVRRASWGVRLVILLTGAMLACGGDDICLQCPTGTPTPGQTGAIVTGQIANIAPFQNPSNVTVVICVDLEQGQSIVDCPNSFLTEVNTQGLFTRTNVKAGAETIFFWVETDDDGIDEDDLIAQLQDPQGRLEAVQTGQTVTLANVRIDFNAQTATADITVGNTPTPTPSAVQATPTPSPT